MYAGQINQQTGAGLGGIAMVAAAAYSNEPNTRNPELPAAIEMMERGLCLLEDNFSELAARLTGVLQPPVPEPASPEQIRGGGTPASGYASTIHAQGMRLAVLRERVQDLLRRLEV